MNSFRLTNVATTALLLMLGLWVKTVSANNITWSGCGPIEDPLTRLKVDQRTVICLHVGNTEDWGGQVTYLRLSFSPKIDQYSRFHVSNSYLDLVRNAPDGWRNRNISVGVASQQHLSFLRLYHEFSPSSGAGKIFPHLTAIIDVEHGRVRGVTWDDACGFCGGGECTGVTYDYNGVPQTRSSAGQAVGGCPSSEDECAANPESCDLLLYVVWTGTDADGHSFQSAANRFSNFPAQDISDRLTRFASSASGNENN